MGMGSSLGEAFHKGFGGAGGQARASGEAQRQLAGIGQGFLDLARGFKQAFGIRRIQIIGGAATFTFGQKMFGNGRIEIITAKGGITAGCLHLEDALLHFKQGNIKGAAAKIVNGIKAFGAVIKAIGKGGRGWFIDQTQDFDPGQTGGILGCGACTIIEVGRNGDDRLFDRLAKAFLGPRTKRTQDIGGNLHRGQDTVTDIQAHHHRFARFFGVLGRDFDMIWQRAGDGFDIGYATAHQAFDRRYDAIGIIVDLITGRLAHHRIGIRAVIDDGGHDGIATGCIAEHFGFFIVRDRDDGIRRTQIDTNGKLAFIFVGQRRLARFVDL